MKLFRRLAPLLCAFALTAHGQLVRQPNTTLTLPADLPSATGYQLENALGTLTFSAPMGTAVIPGDKTRLFVAQRGGIIRMVSNLGGTPASATYLNINTLLGAGETLRNDSENGLLSMVVHPQFATNGILFVYYSLQVVEGSNTRLFQRLHKIVVANPAANTATNASDRTHAPVLTILDPDTNHNGGDLAFGPDGYLYLSLGDGGSGGDFYDNARYINKSYWGKLIRLDVDTAAANLAPNPHTQASTTFPSAIHPGMFRVPADNPFIGRTTWNGATISATSVRTEIYATGLRNPFRFSFDPPTGRLFLGDVGQGIYEEVDIVTKGADLGWSWREGFRPYASPPAPQAQPAGYAPLDPIYAYDHTNDTNGPFEPDNDPVIWGSAITGGMVYRGNQLTELNGAYLFADYNSGFLVALRENNGVWTGQRLLTKQGLVDFGPDPRNGETLLCDLSAGIVWRIARTATTGDQPPARLSLTGAFTDLATLTPQPGLVAYAPRVSFWSDNAEKARWFAIRNSTDTVGFNATANWTLPTGMVWVKHFEIDVPGKTPLRRKLETRFLVKTATDVYGLSYRWREDQSEADLVVEEGLSAPVATGAAQQWRFPSRAECRTCHTAQSGHALSFNTRQMNRDHLFGTQTQNQIAALSAAGYFSAVVPNVQTLPALPDPADANQSLEARVRSYLMVNCSQCHQPNGAAPTNWDARIATSTDLAGLIRGPLANPFGDAANRFAVPNDLGHSMVYRRLQGNDVPRMPPLATNERDLAAEFLISAWITQSLPARQSFADWQTLHFGAPTAPAAVPTFDADRDGQTNGQEFLQGTLPTTPNIPPTMTTSFLNNEIRITFLQPANRAARVETSTDLTHWNLWDVPGNTLQYPATDTQRTLTAPMDAESRYFRLRLEDL
jgi:glucose/arabinose dehydrogenase